MPSFCRHCTTRSSYHATTSSSHRCLFLRSAYSIRFVVFSSSGQDRVRLCYRRWFRQILICCFQDVNDKNSHKYAKLYVPGHLNLLFNKKEFFKSVGMGIATSFIIFFIPYGTFYDAANPYGTGVADHQLFGTVVSTLLVIVVTVQVCLASFLFYLYFKELCIRLKDNLICYCYINNSYIMYPSKCNYNK